MKKKGLSILFSLVLSFSMALSFSLISVIPVLAQATTTTLTTPDNVYRPEEFVVSSTTTNSGTAYTNVRFNITVSGPDDFTGTRADTFTITKVNGSTDTQGINDTFVLVNGDWVGYWGPVNGFPLTDPYDATSTFTIEMNNTTAPLVNYDMTVELVDFTPEPDIILATATDSFSLSADTLHVGKGDEQFTTIQAAVDAASAGDTIVVPEGTYSITDGLVINTAGVTIILEDGVIIQNNSPCFVVNADYTKITTGSIGGATCIPTGGSNGIDVAANLTNIIIEGLEINGTGQTTGDGINFAGAITDVQIIDNYIHDLDGDGVYFTATPLGTVDIQGNLFLNNSGVGISSPADINVAYNAWGSYGGPITGDGISGITSYTPWTHVDLYLESTNPDVDNWLDQVFVGEKITYNVKANLENVMGAVFVLEYPSNLTVDTTALGGQFESELLDVGVAGKLSFMGYQIVESEVSGEELILFTVTFNGVTAGKDLVLNLDQTTDIFSMAPASGPSNNIYATALEDITSLDVITRPTLDIVGLDGPFVAGLSHVITNTTCNAATGGDWTESVDPPIEPDTIGWIRISDITIAEIASLEFLWGGNWYDFEVQDAVGGTAVQQDGDDVIARFGNFDFGLEVQVDSCGDVDSFRVTFVNPGVHYVTVELYDMMDTSYDGIDPNDILLTSSGPVMITIDGDFDITGTVSMQGRTVRSGVPVTLTKVGLPVYGPFNATSIDVISNNLTFTLVNGGTYTITTNQPRYLNVYAGLGKQIYVAGNTTITLLELKGGNAVWSDNVINAGDASFVGTWYGQTVDTDADVNFSGNVDIFDLALVGGNYDLTSAIVYGTWTP